MKKDLSSNGSVKKSAFVLSRNDMTDEQRQAVDGKGKIIVSASAGSGKTATMITRILREIAEGTPIDRILVLVYNDAAAAELKERLHGALFEAACAAGGASGEMFRRAIDGLSGARISTIHSFCRSLIRENFELLGVSPSFDIMSDRNGKRLMSAAMESVFERFHAAGDATFMRLADTLSSGRSEENLRDVVQRVYAVVEIQPDRAEFIKKVRESYLDPSGGEYTRTVVDEAKRTAKRIRRVLEWALSRHAATEQTKYVERSVQAIAICLELEKADFDGICRIAAAGTDALPAVRRPQAGADEAAIGATKNAVEALKDMFKDWNKDYGDGLVLERHRQNAEFAGKLLDIVTALFDELAALKREADVMSYSDLEYYAAELVRQKDFKGNFDAVFVDEYQDVNPVQEFIINGVLPDKAFMVGDVKQSIYAFRLADPGIFLKRRSDYENGGGEAVNFNKNFRSVNAVLRFVNEIFELVMTEESAGIDYAADGRFAEEEKLDAEGNPVEGGVEIRFFAYPGNSTTKAARAEGRYIAGRIKELVGKACDAEHRPLTYSDCVVLLRSRNGYSRALLDELSAAGIPLNEGSFRSNASLTESELMCFLTVLDNPRNDIPLASFMLSWFGGFDESELAEISARRPEGGEFYDAVLATAEEDDPLGHKVADMLAMLESYRLRASFRSVEELLSGIVGDFAYDAYAESREPGSSENIAAFVASTHSEDPTAGLSRFIALYNTAKESREEEKVPGGNRVRVATYHAFKGLESPVVFAAGVNPSPPRQSQNDFVIANNGYIGMKWFDFEGRAKRDTLSYKAVRRMNARRELAEEMRLYYVLLTRAKQYLIVTGACARKKSASFGTMPLLDEPRTMRDYLSEVCFRRGLRESVVTEDAEDAAAAYSDPLPPVLPEADEKDVERIRASFAREYAHTDATGLAMKYSVSALEGGEEIVPDAFRELADEGTAYHKVMEWIDYEKTGTEAVKVELERLVAEGYVTPEETESVSAEAIARCLDSPLLAEARASRCYREKKFVMYVPAREVGRGTGDDKVLVQGVVDLLIDGEKKTIVDFKNSALRSAEAMQKYKKQLNLYKKAAESAFFGKIDRLVLYSFKTGETVDIPFENPV